MLKTLEKIRNNFNKTNWELGIGNWELKKGFTLVELIVVTAIIAIMSAATVVGFGYIGDTLKTREVTGILSDLIKQEELKILRGDFVKVTIKFLSDYVVVGEEPEGTGLDLSLKEDPSCAERYKIVFGNEANLTKMDSKGEIIDIKAVKKDQWECVTFKDAPDTEWNYRIADTENFSQNIRFIHFNIQREDLNNPISITAGADSKIELTAPYGKKIIYDNFGNTQSKITLTVSDKNNNSSDTLVLQ